MPARGSALYSEQVRAHYANPRNAGCLPNPSGRAIVRSPVDSDTVLITLRIENDVIQDVKFKCMGCAVAIACSSVATKILYSFRFFSFISLSISFCILSYEMFGMS